MSQVILTGDRARADSGLARNSARGSSDAEKLFYLDRNRPYLAGAIYTAALSMIFCQLGFEVLRKPVAVSGHDPARCSRSSARACSCSRGDDFDVRRASARHLGRRGLRWPTVDIFLPVSGEALEVLRNTWEGVAGVVWAYPGIAAVHVLDDAANPLAREMARKVGFGYMVETTGPGCGSLAT